MYFFKIYARLSCYESYHFSLYLLFCLFYQYPDNIRRHIILVNTIIRKFVSSQIRIYTGVPYFPFIFISATSYYTYNLINHPCASYLGCAKFFKFIFEFVKHHMLKKCMCFTAYFFRINFVKFTFISKFF